MFRWAKKLPCFEGKKAGKPERGALLNREERGKRCSTWTSDVGRGGMWGGGGQARVSSTTGAFARTGGSSL